MPTPKLSDELARQAADAYRAEDRNNSRAAKSIGLDPETFRNRLKRAAERGMLLDEPPAMPGFRVTRVNSGPNGRSVEQKPELGPHQDIPKGHTIKGVSVLENGDGETLLRWVKTREGDLDPLQLAEALRDSFKDYVPAAPAAPAPAHSTPDEFLTLVPCADWHLGMFAWGKETGTNWDLKIAQETLGQLVEDVISRSTPSGTCVVLGGGDLLHSDNKENRTARSGHALDVDGRYQKVLLAAGHLMVRTVEAALRRHGRVVVRILPGNHDDQSASSIAYFLHAWFRIEPRVTVDLDPSLYWKWRHGRVMLAATHGHTVKLSKMPGIMAARWPEEWGATRFRFAHGFHIHHTSKGADEEGGVLWESHQTPIPQDAYHYNAGYLAGRSQKAITYHRENGFDGLVNRSIADALPRVDSPPLAPA